MIPPVKQTRLDRIVENIKALGLDKTPVHFYSTDFTKGHILTVYDDKRGEDVAIGTINDFWHPELFSSAPELALEVQQLREENQRLLDYLVQVADEYTDADGITYEIYCKFGNDEE